jgi:hypothetical protein
MGLRGQDLNLRPSGYEPDELPDCSTPRLKTKIIASLRLACKGDVSSWPQPEGPLLHWPLGIVALQNRPSSANP